MVSTLGLRPVGEGERRLAPDLARGVMLALIAVANSAVYLYGRPYGIRQHIIEHDLPDRVTAALSMTFVDGRAYPMFAALFGYGMVQIWNRRRDDDEGRRVLKRRSLWLLAFGAVHAVLLFSGDVLGVYGLLGLAICRLLRVRDRTLPALAGAWLVPVALLSALTAGAIGYLLKDSPREEVFRAVRAAALGETVLSPAVAARVLNRVRTPAPAELSERERTVLSLVARGSTNKEAAAALFISETTVKTHLAHIYTKLGVSDRASAVAVAYDRGLLP